MPLHLSHEKEKRVIHLASLALRGAVSHERYPFTVPIIQALSSLDFPSAVTFLVGENGSGKSTLLEAIACAASLPTVGSESVSTDKTLADIRPLAKQLRLSWAKRTHRGFFMRTEDFFGFARWLTKARDEYREDIARVDRETAGRSELARDLARSPYLKELHDMERRYGEDLGARSHGESYFKLFRSRFVPEGLYMLDEPEAPLSPIRQLSLISMLKEMVEEKGAQFIIATHSPILMAYPGATIYSFDGGTVKSIPYNEVEHVTVTRDFLNSPEQFLRHL
jgi:predicted ATPase